MTTSEVIWESVCFLAVITHVPIIKMWHHPRATVTPQHGGAPLRIFQGASERTPSCSHRRVCRGAPGPAVAPEPAGFGAAAALPRQRRHGPPAPWRASAVGIVGENTFWHGFVAYFWVQILRNQFYPILGFEMFRFHLSCPLFFEQQCDLLLGTAISHSTGEFRAEVRRKSTTRHTTLCMTLCISGSKSLVTRRNWDPRRLSAWSANSCSGPNLSAVASARHRSLGPWYPSHGSWRQPSAMLRHQPLWWKMWDIVGQTWTNNIWVSCFLFGILWYPLDCTTTGSCAGCFQPPDIVRNTTEHRAGHKSTVTPWKPQRSLVQDPQLTHTRGAPITCSGIWTGRASSRQRGQAAQGAPFAQF